MTILSLTDFAIAPLSDLSDVLLFCQEGEASTTSTSAGIRDRAGGRRVIVTTPLTVEVVQATFDHMTRSEYESLKALAGRVVLFRDQFGKRLFGMFPEISERALSFDNDRVGGVSIVLENVTVSEIV